jgi:hypothetical protein
MEKARWRVGSGTKKGRCFGCPKEGKTRAWSDTAGARTSLHQPGLWAFRAFHRVLIGSSTGSGASSLALVPDWSSDFNAGVSQPRRGRSRLPIKERPVACHDLT